MNTVQVQTSQPVPAVHAIPGMEPYSGGHGTWRPGHEFTRTRQGMTYSFDLPGVLPANLHVECREGRLWVWGNRNAVHTSAMLEQSSHRPTGAFEIDLPLGDWLDPERISKEFKDGVLTVFIPKRREFVSRT